MCGRFNVTDSPGIQALLKDLGLDLSLPPGINLAPTETIPLLRESAGPDSVQRHMDGARWWLVPSWAREVSQKYAMFNARSETAASSRAFATPFKRQRGIVPMSSFIEWRNEGGQKQPWLITNPEQALAVAALWEVWDGGIAPLLSCTLMTTAAAPEFTPWHKRMPVLLAADERDAWLDNSRPIRPDDAIFRSALKSTLCLHPVSRAVGNSRNKDAALLAPVGDMVELAA